MVVSLFLWPVFLLIVFFVSFFLLVFVVVVVVVDVASLVKLFVRHAFVSFPPIVCNELTTYKPRACW